jgi:hypothetical protein
MLTDTAIRNAKPRAKPYKLSDAQALYLLITPNGTRLWRLKYRIQGREKQLALGAYPEVSLKQARDHRDEARRLLALGVDPGEKKQTEKTTPPDTFEAIAREWFAKFSVNWAASHSEKIIRRLELDLFPWIGSRPIGSITPPKIAHVPQAYISHTLVEPALETWLKPAMLEHTGHGPIADGTEVGCSKVSMDDR